MQFNMCLFQDISQWGQRSGAQFNGEREQIQSKGPSWNHEIDKKKVIYHQAEAHLYINMRFAYLSTMHDITVHIYQYACMHIPYCESIADIRLILWRYSHQT